MKMFTSWMDHREKIR